MVRCGPIGRRAPVETSVETTHVCCIPKITSISFPLRRWRNSTQRQQHTARVGSEGGSGRSGNFTGLTKEGQTPVSPLFRAPLALDLQRLLLAPGGDAAAVQPCSYLQPGHGDPGWRKGDARASRDGDPMTITTSPCSISTVFCWWSDILQWPISLVLCGSWASSIHNPPVTVYSV